MAMEQFYAFLAGQPLADLGETTIIGPERFPMLANSELRREHELLNAVIAHGNQVNQGGTDPASELAARKANFELLSGDDESRSKAFLAILERYFAFYTWLSDRAAMGSPYAPNWFSGNLRAYGQVLSDLLRKGVVTDMVLIHGLRWIAVVRDYYCPYDFLFKLLELAQARHGSDLPSDIRDVLIEMHGHLTQGLHYRKSTFEKLQATLGQGLWDVLQPCDPWAHWATEQLRRMAASEREAWVALLWHCMAATGAKPTAKWTKTGKALLDEVGRDPFVERVGDWFQHIDQTNPPRFAGEGRERFNDPNQRLHERNADVLRGLLWLCLEAPSPEMCRAVASVALSAYRKVPGIGPRAVKVGNACLHTLGHMPGMEGIAQIAILKARVKFGTAQKLIEKAFVETAARMGMGRDDVEEMSVPA